MSKFTLEEINEAVEHYFNGKESAKDMAKSLGINQSTFTEWIRHYEHNGLSVYAKPYTSYTLEFKRFWCKDCIYVKDIYIPNGICSYAAIPNS